MQPEMRRKDRRLPEAEALAVLAKGEYGVLATMGALYPYAVPLNYVLLDGALYFHGAAAPGLKAENLRQNAHVSFAVVSDAHTLPARFSEQYESAIVFGTAAPVDGEEKRAALTALIKKYSAPYLEAGLRYVEAAQEKTAVYRISIDQLTGKARR